MHLKRNIGFTLAIEDIHFDFDKYDIRPGDVKTLDANAQWMKASAGRRRR